MNPYLKRSRISKALTDAGRATSFVDAESRLDAIHVTVALGRDQAPTPAGQAAALTALATALKCFGAVTLVADVDLPLVASLPVGATIMAAAQELGAEISQTFPTETTHSVAIGDATPAMGWQLRCWWDRWLSGTRVHIVEPIGDSRLPLSGVFAAAIAIRQIFASVLSKRSPSAREVTISLWEPWAEADASKPGPTHFEVPNRLWFLGLGHLGQAFIWNLCLMPQQGERFAVLQDDQIIGEENEPTSLLVTTADVGKRKTRVSARWLEACGLANDPSGAEA